MFACLALCKSTDYKKPESEKERGVIRMWCKKVTRNPRQEGELAHTPLAARGSKMLFGKWCFCIANFWAHWRQVEDIHKRPFFLYVFADLDQGFSALNTKLRASPHTNLELAHTPRFCPLMLHEKGGTWANLQVGCGLTLTYGACSFYRSCVFRIPAISLCLSISCGSRPSLVFCLNFFSVLSFFISVCPCSSFCCRFRWVVLYLPFLWG